nr:hypothetical protein [Lachnospiraceae bacterium]
PKRANSDFSTQYRSLNSRHFFREIRLGSNSHGAYPAGIMYAVVNVNACAQTSSLAVIEKAPLIKCAQMRSKSICCFRTLCIGKVSEREAQKDFEW